MAPTHCWGCRDWPWRGIVTSQRTDVHKRMCSLGGYKLEENRIGGQSWTTPGSHNTERPYVMHECPAQIAWPSYRFKSVHQVSTTSRQAEKGWAQRWWVSALGKKKHSKQNRKWTKAQIWNPVQSQSTDPDTQTWARLTGVWPTVLINTHADTDGAMLFSFRGIYSNWYQTAWILIRAATSNYSCRRQIYLLFFQQG